MKSKLKDQDVMSEESFCQHSRLFKCADRERPKRHIDTCIALHFPAGTFVQHRDDNGMNKFEVVMK